MRRATHTVTASHPLLEPVAKHLEVMAAFDRHEAIFFEVGRRSRVLLSAFIWRTDRGQVRRGRGRFQGRAIPSLIPVAHRRTTDFTRQALGGVRMTKYHSLGDMIRYGSCFETNVILPVA